MGTRADGTHEHLALRAVLTVRETASALRTTPDAIYRRIRRGTLPSVRDGRRLLVPASAVEALLGGRLQPIESPTMLSGSRGLRQEPRMRSKQPTTNRTTCTKENFFSILPMKAGQGRARWVVNFYVFKPGRARPRNVRRRSPHRSKAETRTWATLLVVELTGEPSASVRKGGPTVGDVCERWLATQARDRRNKARYLRWIKLAWGAETPIAAVTHEKIVGLPAMLGGPLGPQATERSRKRRPSRTGRQRRRKGEGLGLGSTRSVCQAANRILDFAAQMDWRDEARVPLPAVPIPDAEWFTVEELRQLLDVSGPWKLAIMLGARAGLRRGEIVELRWGDVDLRRGAIRVARAYKSKDGSGPGREWHVSNCKGREARTVAIPPDLVDVLRASRGPRDDLVVRTQVGARVMPWALSEIVPSLAQRAGVYRPGVGVHALRHTFCSHLAQGGAPMMAIQLLAGHRSPRTTERYMHLSPRHVEAAISCLPTLDLTGDDETLTKLNEEAPENGA